MGFEDTDEPETDNSLVKKVFIICEGAKTEPNYLDYFQKAHQKDGSLNKKEKTFEIRNIEKISFDTNNTNRKDMMKLLDGEMIKLHTGKITPFFLITLVLREYSRLIGLNDRIKTSLHSRKKYLFDKFESSAVQMGILMGGTITDVEWFISRAEEIIEEQDKMVKHDHLDNLINSLGLRKREQINTLFGKLVGCYEELFNADSPEDISKRYRGIRKEIIENNQEIKKMDDHWEIVSDKPSVINAVIERIKNDLYYLPEYEGALKCGDLYKDEDKTTLEEDRKFIIFDRDYDDFKESDEEKMIDLERTDEDYNEIIDFCSDKRRNYEVLMSTPFFEFWLLMHHSDANYNGINRSSRRIVNNQIIEKEKILENIKKKMPKIDEETLKRALKKELKDLSWDRFKNYYKDTFDYALEQSTKFATDPRDLITEIGSNVGIKLNSLLNSNNCD